MRKKKRFSKETGTLKSHSQEILYKQHQKVNYEQHDYKQQIMNNLTINSKTRKILDKQQVYRNLTKNS